MNTNDKAYDWVKQEMQKLQQKINELIAENERLRNRLRDVDETNTILKVNVAYWERQYQQLVEKNK